MKGSSKPALPAGAQQSGAGGGFSGTLALPARPAPPIDLRNYLGQPVTLSAYRGKAVLVTFLYTNCPDVCPLITSNLRVAMNLLGARRSKAQIIAVSVDPRGDTPAAVARFLRAHGMAGRMQYLIGSAGELSRTWAAWNVGSSPEVGQPRAGCALGARVRHQRERQADDHLPGHVRTERDRARRAKAGRALAVVGLLARSYAECRAGLASRERMRSMTITNAVILNVLLDIALLGLLAFVMSRASKLTPHRPGAQGDPLPQRSPVPRRHSTTYQTATTISTPSGNRQREDRSGQEVRCDRDLDLWHESS